MQVVRCDGSPAAVAELTRALAEALDGGPAVLPVGAAVPGASGGLGSLELGSGAGVGLPEAESLPEPGAGAALVIETSGSTGGPKRVVLSAAALRASARATDERLGGPGHWLLALPAHHVAGAQVISRGLLAGHRPTALDCRDGFRAERFAEVAAALLAETTGQRHYTSLVPTQLHRVLTEGGVDGAGGPALAALREFDAVLVGGAATPTALLTEARRAGVRVVTTYGMSETAGGCVYNGSPLAGAEVRLDPADGRISVAGPMLASGYLGDPALTAASFRDGWFDTSDLGCWASDGRLRVLGRADDVIITGGEKVHPAAIERVLTAQPGVRAACVVGLIDPEWGQVVAAAVVCADSAGLNSGGLGSAVRAELGAASVPRLLRELAELPLRGIGKPDRAEVVRLLGDTVRRAP
ncbi:MAG TPA: o-succinylbenzoate--CoA ligase [Pseudonocardia sp.]|nr:o-succinylbenzoate--CoA ligase [Pseudonocardia sp.]